MAQDWRIKLIEAPPACFTPNQYAEGGGGLAEEDRNDD
jgi:hypothetical protein